MGKKTKTVIRTDASVHSVSVTQCILYMTICEDPTVHIKPFSAKRRRFVAVMMLLFGPVLLDGNERCAEAENEEHRVEGNKNGQDGIESFHGKKEGIGKRLPILFEEANEISVI